MLLRGSLGKSRAGEGLSPLGSLLSPLGSFLSPGILLAGQGSRGDGSRSGASPGQEKLLQNRTQSCWDMAKYPLQPGMCLTTASRIILLLLGAASWHSCAQPSPGRLVSHPGQGQLRFCHAGMLLHLFPGPGKCWVSLSHPQPPRGVCPKEKSQGLPSLTPLQSLQPSTSGMLGGSCSLLGITHWRSPHPSSQRITRPAVPG